MLNLSLNELKLLAKRLVAKLHNQALEATKACLKKDYETLTESESVASATPLSAALLNKIPLSKNSFDDERLKKIRKDFINLKHRFSKPEIKEIRKNVYVIKKL